MASADLYTPSVTFLAGDAGDVRGAINAEQPGIMGLGSVPITRPNRGEIPRQRNALPLTVEVIRAPTPPAARQVGPGWKERDVVFELAIALRQKDLTGSVQRVTLEQVMRALVARYDGLTNLAIAPSGATFVRSSAEVTSADENTESAELARAVVRITLTFVEPQGVNT